MQLPSDPNAWLLSVCRAEWQVEIRSLLSTRVTFHPLMMNLCVISWFDRVSHGSAGAGSVFWLPLSAPRCFQLLHVRWWRTGTASLKQEQHKKSAHSVKGTNQRKPREHLSHAIITTKSLARDELTTEPTVSPYCFQGRKMLTAWKYIFLLCKSFSLPLSNVTVL